MAGNTTNIISFSKNKAYLIKFLSVLLTSELENDKLIVDNFYDYLKLLLTAPPREFVFKKQELSDNQIQIPLPNWNDKKTEYNFYLSYYSQVLIQKWLYRNFTLLFKEHLKFSNGFLNDKEAIYLFIEMYKLNDFDFSEGDVFEMLKKKSVRQKKKLIPNKLVKITSHFRGNLSLKCPQFVPFS